MTLSIQTATDTLIASVPGAPFADTVDTIKIGDASQELRGIVVTFLASSAVIGRAAQLGANLIITHEPIFYNHKDETDWLSQHPTYRAKKELIEKHGLVIWRFHDYLHSIPPDSTVMGMLKELGWEAYALPDQPHLCTIPRQTLQTLGEWVQTRLGNRIRVVGDLAMTCEKICVLPGFPVPDMQIGIFEQANVDVLITGEIHEWEVSEYVRDATALGFEKGLIVTGHAASEEPGIKRMLPWIQERLPGVAIHYIPTGSAFHYL